MIKRYWNCFIVKSYYSTNKKMFAGLPTFSQQSKIPRLPIPSLSETASKYLLSLQPLLTPEHYERVKVIVSDFIDPEKGFGQELQKRLIEYDKSQKYSWLEKIWFEKAYLEYRDPTLINVNWFMTLKDHPKIPESLKKLPAGPGDYTDFQIKRAAGIIRYALEFNDLINKEKIPIDEAKGKAFCMNQYRCMFQVTRLPDLPGDKLVFQYPTSSKKVIVLIEDQVYSLQVIHASGQLYSKGEILVALQNLLKMHKTNSDKQPPVNVLTGEHRDIWTKAYRILISSSPVNHKSFEMIKDSLFAISLDDVSPGQDLDAFSRLVFHRGDSRNRWFDKCLSFMVFPNGRAGLNGEHSPCDAVVPGRILDYIVAQETSEGAGSINELESKAQAIDASRLPAAAHVKWQIPVPIRDIIDKALVHNQAIIDDIDLSVLIVPGFGSERLKQLKLSPDGIIQMSMQLAFFRMHKRFAATYESGATRSYLHGRTECVRVLSNESVAFVKTMSDYGATNAAKFASLQKALQSHNAYMTDATLGKGVDRHWLGLRVMMKKGEEHAIFKDPSYGQSVNFELSTSNMSPGTAMHSLGFGPVSDTGYGINYAIAKDLVKYSITSKFSCKDTSSTQFRAILDQSLRDIVTLASSNAKI